MDGAIIRAAITDGVWKLRGRACTTAIAWGTDRLAAIQRLDAQARVLERTAGGPTLEQFIGQQRADSAGDGGRTVFDDRA